MELTECRYRFREACQLRKVERTQDTHRLMRMWRKSPYEYVRFVIVSKLEDQGFMAVIARGDSSSSVWAEAVKRLKDKRLLRRISFVDKSDFVRDVARVHFEYAGPEPWLTAQDDEELRRMVVDYLIKHASFANERGRAESENV